MDVSTYPAVVELISNVGFPIVLSIYLLHRMEKKLDSMIHVLEALQEGVLLIIQEHAQTIQPEPTISCNTA